LDDVSAAVDPRVRAAVAGDRAALAAVLTELLPRMRNLVRYLLPGDQDVDDVTQEALIAIVRGLATYRGEGRLESWADRVTARQAMASARQRSVARARFSLVPEQDLELLADRTGANQEDYVARRQVVRQLDAIPEAQRQVLVLHHVVGLAVGEIAAELGVPLETVRSRLRLGKARFNQLFATSASGSEE